MFVALLLLGFLFRVGFGVVRYRHSLEASGTAFIQLWDHDALYHVLIARGLLSGKGYIVDNTPALTTKPLRYQGQQALFKAPLYEFFLAGIFWLSGFSFTLLLPLQAAVGGLTAGFVGLITSEVFQRQRAAWFAGLAAAAQPILINSASQPYNENLYFFFFVGSIWSCLLWFKTHRVQHAMLCGIMVGLCMLTRESALVILAAIGVTVLLTQSIRLTTWGGYALIVAITIAVVSPWTLRNYVRFGAFVPVAAIVGTDFTEGNNECVAEEGILVPYWAEGPCPAVNEQRRLGLETRDFDKRVPDCVRVDLVSRQIGKQFVREHPLTYLKLSVRRLWTSLLPYDPRGNQRPMERVVLLLYWLVVFPAGMFGLIKGRRLHEPGKMLLALVMALTLISIAVVLYWSDLRFMVGIYLLLGCFAGWTYDEFLPHPRATS